MPTTSLTVAKAPRPAGQPRVRPASNLEGHCTLSSRSQGQLDPRRSHAQCRPSTVSGKKPQSRFHISLLLKKAGSLRFFEIFQFLRASKKCEGRNKSRAWPHLAWGLWLPAGAPAPEKLTMTTVHRRERGHSEHEPVWGLLGPQGMASVVSGGIPTSGVLTMAALPAKPGAGNTPGRSSQQWCWHPWAGSMAPGKMS